MRCIESLFLAAAKPICTGILGAVFFVVPAVAARHPRYGGTLRIELSAQSISLDPREWKPGSLEETNGKHIAALLFERLVTVDKYGRIQPQLAVRWTNDGGSFRRWQFTIRSGVKFSDGTPLTASDVAAALQLLLPTGQQAFASGNTVIVQCSAEASDLLEQLAFGRTFVYRVAADGTFVGTGAFVAERSLAAALASGAAAQQSETAPANVHLRFHANENAWAGRPFLDAVDVTLGVPPLRAMFDLQLGKADLIELAPDLVRRATQANLRHWASAPATLLALRFDDARPDSANIQLRQALSLSLDRGTMAGVLLQKQADPATALLPQWLSGYAFLLAMNTNLDRAKELRSALPAGLVGVASPLRLQVDTPGDLAKLLGERVAVNARQAGILLQAVNRSTRRGASTSASPAPESTPDLHLLQWNYSSLSPHAELDSFAAAYNLAEQGPKPSSTAEPEQLYEREKRLLEDFRILPLVTLPEFVGLGASVRDWMPLPWGEWNLADVWLDLPETEPLRPANAASQRPLPSPTGAAASVSGARP